MTSEDKPRNIALKLAGKQQKKISEYIRQREISEYAGKGVYCPVCDKEFRDFAPFFSWRYCGEEEAVCHTNHDLRRCPNCNSLERQRLLWLFLHEKLEIHRQPSFKVLEFAPDPPFFSYFSSLGNVSYFPCDLHPEADKYSGISEQIIKADVCTIPFKSNQFDLVLCCHVLEHVSDDRKALGELFRVMKNGGKAIFQVPVVLSRDSTFEDASVVSPHKREELFGQYDHLRVYGRDYPDILQAAGFHVSADDFAARLSPDQTQRFGIDRDEVVWLVEKPFRQGT